MNPTTIPCTCDDQDNVSATGTSTVMTDSVTVVRFNCDECDGMTHERIETCVSTSLPWYKRKAAELPHLVTEIVSSDGTGYTC